ncbi:MAG: hypothetical protein LLG09_07460 [Negativicutes bacterium]|nr:hypothetical protein [Negativicutes bacterium]
MSDYDKTFWYLVGQNSNEPSGPSGGGRGPGCFVTSLLFLVIVIPPLWIILELNPGPGTQALIFGTATYLLWRYAMYDQKKREEQKKQEQAKREQEKRDWEQKKQEKLDREKQEQEQQEDPELM